MRLLLSQIRTDGGTQARSSINQMTVAEYAKEIKEGHRFPPIVVFYDDTSYWLADGFHRLEAYRIAGFKDVEVELKLGTLREAILYAVGANAEHGLRRTIQDKHHAVRMFLFDEEWSKWSDRMIAKHTVTSHPFVAKVRVSIGCGNVSTPCTKVTKNGSSSTLETNNLEQSEKSYTEAENFSWQLPPSLLSKVQKCQEKLGVDNLEAILTKLLDTPPTTTRTEIVTRATMRRWMGFDPGLAVVRWAVLEGKENNYDLPRIVDYGIVETTKKRPTSERLWELEQDLVTLLREFQPNNVAMEIPIIGENPKTTRTVLEAAGVIQLVCYREGGIVPVHLYPSMWKAHLGSGRADNEEVTDTLSALFELNGVGRSRLDAIGIAYAAFCGVKVVD